MDDDDFQDMFGQAIKTGLENQAVLEMAAAWCQNIGVTKGLMGTGMVEQLMDLPVTGGSLRCDYAKAPRMFGMALKYNAVEFYEQNCIGCPHRKPTQAAEHLGTWADELIAEREEQRRQQEEELRQEREARQRRHKARRLLFGAPDPTLQSILDLIDRIDVEARDYEAERLLLRHAEMSPGDFPDPLINHMADESIAIASEALLESVIAIFERQGRPATDRILKVAFEAVGRGVAASAAGRVIAAHAEGFDVDNLSLDGIVLLAAGRQVGIEFHRVGSEPAPLIHLFDLDPERAVRVLGAKLLDEDIWLRATAALATDKLIGARPAAGLRLLPALLNAIDLPDKSNSLGDPFASAQARNVVAKILVGDLSVAAREIDARMRTADLAYARKLWRCYDSLARGDRSEMLAKEVAEAIFTRGVALLRQDLDPDFLREVSDTLGLVGRYYGDSLKMLPDVVALVLFWADRVEVYESSAPNNEAATSPEEVMLASLVSEDKRITLRSVLNNIKRVLEACATHHPSDYVELLLTTAWSGSSSSGIGRVLFLDVLGSAI